MICEALSRTNRQVNVHPPPSTEPWAPRGAGSVCACAQRISALTLRTPLFLLIPCRVVLTSVSLVSRSSLIHYSRACVHCFIVNCVLNYFKLLDVQCELHFQLKLGSVHSVLSKKDQWNRVSVETNIFCVLVIKVVNTLQKCID